MIQPELFNYEFDEEALGFGAPQSAVKPKPASPLSRLFLGLTLVGLMLILLQVIGAMESGTWRGFGLGPGLASLAGALYFWASQKDSVPGVKHNGIQFDSLLTRGPFGIAAAVVMTGLYVAIYWFPELLGHSSVAGPSGLVRVVDAPARLFSGAPASQWFLYGVLYSLVMTVFGVRMWMKNRHNRYHQVRTVVVICSQLLLAWLLPNLLVRMGQPYLEFNGVWPLKQDYLWPGKVSQMWNGEASLGPVLLIWAGALALVATPVLTYYYGKRWYCSWICGCGGLSETLGDPFRQLSDKSDRAWKIERLTIYSVLAMVLLTTLALWGNHLSGGSLFGGFAFKLKQWYGFFIGAVFSGVIGVGFYPVLGSRVWCRFGCPQAAILGILQRFFSRFRITTNGAQCISCGNCSTYCEMGIDVRSYAQRGANIVRASCVGCGLCASACPRGVLKLENGKTHVGRD